ncbi:MAG TPA: amino acid adenylation domain-containing protein [Casimicrobiaceae bacterium]|nr:amino acid adenylation domain-containing protein [Casimicrobiaceae bacterium]
MHGDTAQPLSFGQQRLWLLDRMLTQRSSYNVSYALELRGELDVDALRRALDTLVSRHEVLRARIAIVGGEPMQRIAAPASWPLDVVAVTDRAEARDRLRNAAEAPFDLEHGPLMRAQLVRLAPQVHWLTLAMHHIVCDGWSMAVLWRELSACYAAAREGKASQLPPLPLQYADYAVWQRERMQGSRLDAQLDYWRGALAGLSPLDLPTDRERPALPSQRGAKVNFELQAPLTAKLKALARAHGATLFMTLLAAFQVLLSRYSGQGDVAVGVPIAGRNRAEFEGLLGFFVNTLVLRTDLSGDPRFVDVLAQVRARALDAYAHQEVPFEKLVEVLAPKRELARNPLFQVSFAFQNTPRQDPQLAGLEVSALPHDSALAKFDLDLGITEHDGVLRGSFTYALDLFDDASIQRLAEHWKILLEAIVSDAQQRIGALPLCTSAERAQLERWNATRVSYPAHTLAELFEAQVARTPHAIALHEAEQRIEYAQLNRRANALAHRLRELGVGPEVVVGVCLERSVELAVALCAVVKAGGAYLPLDPDYPAARLAFMVEDAAAPIVLTHTGLRDRLSDYSGRVVCIDSAQAELAGQPRDNPAPSATPRNLAYVIYTSGSTGRPKGVMIEHRSLANYLQWFARAFAIGDADAILQKTPIGFDASLEEWLVPLITGARLVIADTRGAMLDVIVDAVQRESITVLQVVPSLLEALLDHPRFRSCTSLRLLVCGAEALSPQLAQRAASQLSAELVNLYGPTETTISSTFWRCERATRQTRSIPIGRPVANTVLKVVDASGELAPLGARGELCIGGVGVARGYLNRDELTQALFARDAVDGERYYRTGDRVRWRSDGTLEFLGRADQQVKIRGFRVEPEETANALARHRAIVRCHVLARTQPTGDLGLTAYVAQRREQAETAATLRMYLATRLPEPMVPVSFVFLDALPVNANGKIDVAALPEPSVQHVVARPRVAPRDRVEQVLCALWSEVLHRQDVSIDDDFFECGGHSLLAARLFARIHEELGLSLPLGVLFEAPTVRQLAERCGVGEDKSYASLVCVSRGGSLPPLFGVPGAFGNVLGFADVARALGSEQPFYGLQSAGLHDDRRPATSIEVMAASYLAEIRRQHPRGPYALLGACFGATVAFEMAQQLLRAGEQVAFLGLLDPAFMGGHDGWTAPVPALPASVHRARTVVSFVMSRLRLYASDLSKLRGRDRWRYVAGKARNVHNVLTQPVPLASARREIAAIAVYQANAKALERYRPRVLAGKVQRVVVFHTARASAAQARRRVDWNRLCGGDTLAIRVSGKDSGDMIRGANAQPLADQIRAQLAIAFAPAPQTAAAVDDAPDGQLLVQQR